MTFAERGSITVLLVEDAPETRDLLAELLELHGLRVLATGSVAEALRVARKAGTIDLLLADLELPDGNGRQLAQTLLGQQPEMRSLFLSGARPPTLGAGQAFLRKPARIDRILGEIRGLLPHSAYGRAS
jgi:CheY-like chemotaxis protein